MIIFNKEAPNITGIAIKNENSVAVLRLNPSSVAPRIVAPDLDVPGIKASIWNIPTPNAVFGVISFTVSTGKDGKVFGSISSKQICEELNKKGYKVDKKQIVITDSLSSIGMFYVDVVLHKKVICKLRVELKSK